jgi:hypothetical protein
MFARFLQRGLALVFAGLAASGTRADDIITNGNFTVGKTHWQGDGDVTDAGGTLFVVLKRDRWKVVAQQVTLAGSHLQLKVTYSLSNFCTLARARSADDPVIPLTSAALKSITGVPNSMPDLPLPGNAAWMVFLIEQGRIVREAPVILPAERSDPYVYTTIFSATERPLVNEDLCFAFPPGKGMVTIANVQLLRAQ